VQETLTIGSRGSPLALWQANAVRAALLAAHPDLAPERVAVEAIKTSGDKIQDRLLREAGGKGLFTKEIEEALLDGRIDLAVHSSKDMPTDLPGGLVLAAFLEREDPRDALIAAEAESIEALSQGARVGTGSLRRQAQLLARRPDLAVTPLRGNVQTRLDKIARGEADATLMAYAGLKRLKIADAARAVLAVDEIMPAPAQGAVCIESRADDAAMRERLAAIDHRETAIAVTAERALLAALEGSCRTPIAALAEIDGERLSIRGRLIAPDGRACFETMREGSVGEADAVGRAAGEALRGDAGERFFREILDAS